MYIESRVDVRGIRDSRSIFKELGGKGTKPFRVSNDVNHNVERGVSSLGLHFKVGVFRKHSSEMTLRTPVFVSIVVRGGQILFLRTTEKDFS